MLAYSKSMVEALEVTAGTVALGPGVSGDKEEHSGGRVLPLRRGLSVALEVTGDTELAVSGTPGRHAGAEGIP